MATIAVNPTQSVSSSEPERLSFRDAMSLLSREERFMATVQAMNTLLIEKGFYTTEEMENYYCQWAKAQILKPKRLRAGWSRFLSWF